MPEAQKFPLKLWHGVTFIAGWSLLGIVLVSHAKADGSGGPSGALAFLLGLAGPLAPGIFRGQSCCMEFSLMVFAFSGPAFASAFGVQWFAPIDRLGWFVVRSLAWTAGLLFWFGGGIVAGLHAFN